MHKDLRRFDKCRKYITGTRLIMVKVLFVILLIAQPEAVNAVLKQDGYAEINGIVKDAVTGRHVPFASVWITGSHTGTVSNIDGVFTLKIPGFYKMNEISISHIGYKKAGFPIDMPESGYREFHIQPHPLPIQELVIKPTDARSLVVRALNKVEQNYPGEPWKLTGFYRETIRQRRDYVSITEAVVDIYKAPYGCSKGRDMVRIVKGRKSGNVKRADTLLVKLRGGPHVSMLLDIVKNPELLISTETVNLYRFELTDIIKIDETSNYVVSFSPGAETAYPLYYGKLYISVERLAITMAEFSMDLSDSEKAVPSFIFRKPARLRFTPVNTKYLVSYVEKEGSYHVSYLRYEIEFMADWRRRLFRTGYAIVSEMAITERSSDNVVRFAADEAVRPSAVMADMVPVYFDEDFWGEYNYIEPDRSVEAAIKRLNRQLDW